MNAQDCVWLSTHRFQSQTRSQSPCDISSCSLLISTFVVSIADAKPVPVRLSTADCTNRGVAGFNRRREASPRATPRVTSSTFSTPMGFNRRREASPRATCRTLRRPVLRRRFNRRREASPRATVQHQALPPALCIVSIADAKPVPVRRSCRAARPGAEPEFQSQTRSQSPCDDGIECSGNCS